jgi:[ribosomal protein S5]-alanine N-acetyltransferase
VAAGSHGSARVGVIREVGVGDADELAALYVANRDFLAPFEPIRPDSFFTSSGQRRRLSRPVDGWRFAILDDAGAIAGAINISNVVRGAFHSANLGYFVSQHANGRGLATAAVGDVCVFAFGTAGLHRLEAGTLLENVASQRVLEKNRFEQIGVAREYLQIAGRWQDHLLFQRIAADL